MGDSPEQIRTQPFLTGLQFNGLLFLLELAPLQYQTAFIQNGDEDILLKDFQRRPVPDRDRHNPHNAQISAHRQIEVLGLPECIGAGTSPLVVPDNPVRHALFFQSQGGEHSLFLRRGHTEFRLLIRNCQRIQHRAVQQRLDLLCGNPDDLPFVPSLLQLLIAVHEQLHIISLLCRLPGLFFHTGRQTARKHAGKQHNKESNRVIRIIGCQGKPRHCEEEVEFDHTEQ